MEVGPRSIDRAMGETGVQCSWGKDRIRFWPLYSVKRQLMLACRYTVDSVGEPKYWGSADSPLGGSIPAISLIRLPYQVGNNLRIEKGVCLVITRFLISPRRFIQEHHVIYRPVYSDLSSHLMP